MFTTFNSSMDTRSSASSPIASSRPKRTTVARACDWCRLNRVKCDDGQPCKNCRTRGVQCCKDSKSTEQPNNTSASTSSKELDRLRSRVAELEDQLNKKTEELEMSITSSRNSPTTSSEHPSSQCHWPGVWIADPVHPNSQPRYYGPSSFLYFTNRLRIYLDESLGQPQMGNALQSFTSSRASSALSPNSPDDADPTEANLTRQQEEYLLSLFWQSYHSIIPIVDEEELCSHYDSLWQAGQDMDRSPSALIDIILALSMQYSAALIASGDFEPMEFDSNDANTAGHWLYRRCQRLLEREQDTLSICTLQCYIHSAVYLLNASCLHASHRILVLAIHTAHSLGLNRSPAGNLTRPQPALRQRIWWTLLFLDAKLSLELGRPYLINEHDATLDLVGPPGSPAAEASKSNSNYGDINFLSYHHECAKLTVTVRNIATTAFQRSSDAMSNKTSVYEDPVVLQKGTSYLHQSMEMLQNWAQNVPSSLKLARKGNVDAFSTARCSLEIDVYTPLWLQRQRVLLELLYHNLAMSLYRPYIKFPSASSLSTPSMTSNAAQTSDSSALSSLNHAMASINMVHQVLTETDILNSWNRAFQYTWDATLTILGFRLVHPVCPYTFSARRATAIAIETFNIFARNGFSAASSAATITKEADGAIDLLVQSLRGSLRTSQLPTPRSLDSSQFVLTPPQASSSLGTQTPVTQLMQSANLQSFRHPPEPLPQQFGLPQSNSSPTQSMKQPDPNHAFFINSHPAIMSMDLPADLVNGMIDQSWLQNDWQTGMMPMETDASMSLTQEMGRARQ